MKVFGKTERFKFVIADDSMVTICFDREQVNEVNSTWHEIYFSNAHGKPTIEQIKEGIIKDINAETDAKILKDFVWQGINVWLSAENQRNFSEAQRMANEYGERVLPLRFKLGENSDGQPIYHTFETIEELNEFYVSAFSFINQCLAEGWEKKDNFDWTPYEEALKDIDSIPE